MQDVIWITWEHQLRNRSMSSSLGIPLYVIEYKANRLKRYIYCIAKTLYLILDKRPRIIIAQNPSIVLNYFLLTLRPLLRFKFLSDAHFGGVESYNGSRIMQRALDFLNRSVDAVIVTNEYHAAYINGIGGRSFVCEDPLPDLSRYYERTRNEEKTIFFICSFDIDEPYYAAFDAARILSEEGYSFYVSGNYKKAGLEPAHYPYVTFLGYVSEAEFYANLFRSQLVLDLTTHENCLVCGAYEAMAASKPLVTSNRIILRKYFNRGTVYSEHDALSIVQSVKFAYEHRNDLKKDIECWKIQAEDDNNNKIQQIREYIK